MGTSTHDHFPHILMLFYPIKKGTCKSKGKPLLFVKGSPLGDLRGALSISSQENGKEMYCMGGPAWEVQKISYCLSDRKSFPRQGN